MGARDWSGAGAAMPRNDTPRVPPAWAVRAMDSEPGSRQHRRHGGQRRADPDHARREDPAARRSVPRSRAPDPRAGCAVRVAHRGRLRRGPARPGHRPRPVVAIGASPHRGRDCGADSSLRSSVWSTWSTHALGLCFRGRRADCGGHGARRPGAAALVAVLGTIEFREFAACPGTGSWPTTLALGIAAVVGGLVTVAVAAAAPGSDGLLAAGFAGGLVFLVVESATGSKWLPSATIRAGRGSRRRCTSNSVRRASAPSRSGC